ncbi:hypothetical protein L1049_012017 [Liquidambar formosana]|uniref:Arf-GAP domain-containing protein n=1 Tax=Liquidambar formosana TaxID=63359 RepID=A0AAP0X3N6_LIQFO
MCLECSGKHCGLGVHLSFVRSVTMDSWPETHLKKMESNPGGDDALNSFLKSHGIPKEIGIPLKYTTNAAALFRKKIQAVAENRPWHEPAVVQESVVKLPPRHNNGGGSEWKWDDNSGSIRRNHSVGDFRTGVGMNETSRCWSSEDINGKFQGCQGGKYVGFGSNGMGSLSRSDSQGDVIMEAVSVVSQGLGRLSLVASSVVQSAANAIQDGTKELTSKVDGGYDETLNVVASKTTEIRQKTWGIMQDVMALASQKVEEFTRDGVDWKVEGHVHNGSSGQFPEECKGDNNTFKEWDDWGMDRSYCEERWRGDVHERKK